MDIVASREDRRLMRRRGAGTRQMKDTQFGFVVGFCLDEETRPCSAQLGECCHQEANHQEGAKASPPRRTPAPSRTAKKRKVSDLQEHSDSLVQTRTAKIKQKRSQAVTDIENHECQPKYSQTRKGPATKIRKLENENKPSQVSNAPANRANLEPIEPARRAVSSQISATDHHYGPHSKTSTAVDEEEHLQSHQDRKHSLALECQPTTRRKRGRPKKCVKLETSSESNLTNTVEVDARSAQEAFEERQSTTQIGSFTCMRGVSMLTMRRSQIDDNGTSSSVRESTSVVQRAELERTKLSQEVRDRRGNTSDARDKTLDYVAVEKPSCRNKRRRKQVFVEEDCNQGLQKSQDQSEIRSGHVSRSRHSPFAENSPNISRTARSGKSVPAELHGLSKPPPKELSKAQTPTMRSRPKINANQQYKRRNLALIEDDSDSSELKDYGEVIIPTALKSVGGFGGRWKF